MKRKDALFEVFLAEWGIQYKNAKHILAYLSTYPEILEKLNITKLIKPSEIDGSQKEWIWLCEQFDNSAERTFFRPYWIPIQADSYDFFINLSSKNLSIFEVRYFFFEPYRWYKKYLVKHILTLLLSPEDRSINLEHIFSENNSYSKKIVDSLYRERERLGFGVKIRLDEISKADLLADGKPFFFENIKFSENFIDVKGITALIVSLLPHELPMQLEAIFYKEGRDFNDVEKIRAIKDMVFLLQSSGYKRVRGYSIVFSYEQKSFIAFQDEDIIMRHADKALLRNFYEKILNLE